MAKCSATIQIKDECAILPFRCEEEEGHSGDHITYYPGQWGEVRIPVQWEGDEVQKVEFYRNERGA